MLSQPVLGASQAVDTPYPDSPWVVLKFGGRSVSTAENWAIIARLLRERLEEGVRPVVVHSALVGVSTALLLALVAALGWKIRERERETLFKIGAGRAIIARIAAAELFLVLGGGALLAAGFVVALVAWLGSRWGF